MSESPEVQIEGFRNRVREVEWELIDRRRLEYVARKGFEAIVELMWSTREVDDLLRIKKVDRICTDLWQDLERTAST